MSKWIAEFELEDGDKMPEHMDLEYHGAKLDFYCRPLEQEPCEDAVSVASVFEIMGNLMSIPYDFDRSITEKDVSESMDKIRVLPRVTPQESRWIPVNERLPEKSYGCLVTVYDTDLRTQDEFENILPYFVGYDGEAWNNADGEPIPFEVTAWMPLPKPYKGGE